jgi:hypothetical protein
MNSLEANGSGRGRSFPRVGQFLFLILALLCGPMVQAKILFDVFPGFDAVARGGAWFPVVIEVFNDGPSFDAVIELSQSQFNGVPQRFAVELPQNTRKRIFLPCFAGSQGVMAMDARLLDKDGKLRAENLGARVTQLGWEDFILGSAHQNLAGMPKFPDIQGRNAEFQPRVARLSIGQAMETFPENAVVLSALNAIYLNSARALELKEPQVEALMTWLYAGGHLILAIDQPTDVNATPWLKDLLPVAVEGVSTRSMGPAISRWLRNGTSPADAVSLRFAGQAPPLPIPNRGAGGLPDPYASLEPDSGFEAATTPAVNFRLRAGQTLVAVDDAPLLVSVTKGRGLLTAVAFNPEREPFKGWKHQSLFWARLAGVPRDLLGKNEFNAWGGRGLDGVFGAMIETRQVQKLPVGVLLLLLLVYLAVIGPFDRWWLKRINRPMLTWITFPTYVALFSLLIYYIGFRLRAGNSEWNELHVVDVYQRTGDAVMRGYTFGSVYSPANNTYRIGLDAGTAMFRPEFQGFWGNSGSGARIGVRTKAKGIEAELDVPVWTSQLGVAEWVDTGLAPIQARWDGKELVIANRRQIGMTNVMVIRGTRLYRWTKTIDGGGEARMELDGQGESYVDFARNWSPIFSQVAGRRNEVFGGGNAAEHIDQWAEASIAASFAQHTAGGDNSSRQFIWPPTFDLTPLAERGDVVILAYLPGDSLVPPLNQFAAIRQAKGTLIRLVLPPPR